MLRSFLRPTTITAGLIVALCYSPKIQAQNTTTAGAISFTWGEEYELPRRHEDLGFLGNAADGYMQVSHQSHRSLSFQKFSPDLKLQSEKEAEIDNLPRDYSSEWLTQIGSKYYWIFSTYDKDEGRESLFSQELNIKSGEMQGSAKEILHTTKLGGDLARTGLFSFKLANKWNFYTSFDRSKILVQYRKKPESRNDRINSDVIGFNVFDADMQQLWGRDVKMPYTEEMMDNEDYQVDSRGNVYTLAKVYDERRSRDRKHPNYHFEILRWSKDGGNEPTKIPFRFTDRFVLSALITEQPDGGILVCGYYSSHKPNSGSHISGGYSINYSSSADGVFLLKLDEGTKELGNVMKGTYEFPAAVLKQYESRRTRRKLDRKEDNEDAEAENLVLRDVRVNVDGSIELYGETSYIVTVETHNMKTGMVTYRYIYHYDDILAMKVGADGSMKWVKKIPKAQKGEAGKGDMSFKQFSYNGDSYLFYLDNEKNSDLETDETPYLHIDGLGGILRAVKIDDAGKTTIADIYDVREEKVKIDVTDFDEVGNNQLIVRGRARHKESKAALITFK